MRLIHLATLLALSLPSTAQLTRVSVTSSGEELDDYSFAPWISSNGRWVTFTSGATNLSTLDVTGVRDVYRVDLQTGETAYMGIAADGSASTHDGYYSRIDDIGRVVFSTQSDLSGTDSDGDQDVYHRHHEVGETVLGGSSLSASNLPGSQHHHSALTPDGRYLVWASTGDQAGTPTGGEMNIFRRDLLTGTVVQVSIGTDGTQPNGTSNDPEISDDGRFVVFQSWATNLVAGDTELADIYLHDVETGTTECLTLSPEGAPGNQSSKDPDISADGRFVVFESRASNLLEGPANDISKVVRVDLQTGERRLVGYDDAGQVANADCLDPHVSDDGRFVAFESEADNFWNGSTVAGRHNVYVQDLELDRLHLLSRAAPGLAGDEHSSDPVICYATGEVVFTSGSSDLVPGDENGLRDIFLSPLLPASPWTHLGGALPGATSPVLHMRGGFTGGTTTVIEVTDAAPNAPAWVVMGGSRIDLPLFGGVLVPEPVLVVPMPTDANGRHAYDSNTPAGFPPGEELFFQVAVFDPTAPESVAFSNAVSGVSH